MRKLQIQDIRHKIMVDNQLLIVLCELGYILKPKARGSLDHYLNTFCMAELKKKKQSQVRSKAIIAPWSVPIRGGDVCIQTRIAFYKVLLAFTQYPAAFKSIDN